MGQDREPPAGSRVDELQPAGLERGMSEHLGPVDVEGNRLEVLTSSAAQLAAYLKDIDAATTSIDLESYIYAEDSFGQQIAEALVKKSRMGVRVRVMVDAVGSLTTSDLIFERMREAGVAVHYYRPISGLFLRWSFLSWFNRRNHRKLLVIDGGVGYFGGMNIVDTALLSTDLAREGDGDRGWRDVHVRIAGPAAECLATAFERLWTLVTRRAGDKKPKWPRWPVDPTQTRRAIQVYDSFPAIRFRRPEAILNPFLRAARQRVVLSMAYFVPIGSLLNTLAGVRARGVEVDLFVPAESDVPAVLWATRAISAWLLKRQIALFERQGAMLHTKLVRIDDDVTIVGSCNLDPRSLRDNLELFAVIRSRDFAALCDEVLDVDRAASRRVTPEDLASRPWWERTRDWLAWRLRRVL